MLQAVLSPTSEDSSCEVQEVHLLHWESFRRMRAAISLARSLEEMTLVFLGDWSIWLEPSMEQGPEAGEPDVPEEHTATCT